MDAKEPGLRCQELALALSVELIGQGTGRPSFIPKGTYTGITPERFPCADWPLFAWAVIEGVKGRDRRFVTSWEVFGPKGRPCGPALHVEHDFTRSTDALTGESIPAEADPDGAVMAVRCVHDRLTFAAPGRHWLSLAINGRQVKRLPFDVSLPGNPDETAPTNPNDEDTDHAAQ